MKTSIEEMAQPYLIRIVEEDKEVIASKLEEVWNSKKGSIMMDGFRKGKVPQELVEKKEGFAELYRPYIDELITKAVSEVNNNNDLTIMDLQQVVPEQLSREGIVMQAVVYLKPVVTELDYSNVEAVKLDSEVTEEEVNGQLSSYQEQSALIAPVTDRGVEWGDIITIDFVGSLPNEAGELVPFPGGTAKGQKLALTQQAFIPGFGEEILGVSTGESKTFKVTFPENYNATNLAGKEATFDITVNEIAVKDLPELDDELAITLGKANFEELKASVVESIGAKKKQFNQSKTETEICLELVKRAKVTPLPQTMITKRLSTLLQQEASNVGMDAEKYLKQRQISADQFNQMYYHMAVRDLKIQLILDYIADKEGLVSSDADREQYIQTEADRLGYSVEQISSMASVEQLNTQVRLRKAYDFLLENANYVESKSEVDG